ncbi:MAG: hypothetical protein K8W52_13525 [Deltaproteobacteria bacterium]|nr:hypothetical protein [Deltaproteobacteria bacterium]
MRTSWLIVLGVLTACGSIESVVPGAPDGRTPDSRAPDAAAPPVECNLPADCGSYICTDHVCVNTLLVPCDDDPPADATSQPGMVEITYSPGTGWSHPDRCAYTCNAGFCPDGLACTVDRPDIQYDPSNAGSRWFGGDDRPEQMIRSVGQGQSFTVPEATSIAGFAFYFEGPFHSEATGAAAYPTIRYELRDATGGMVWWSEFVVPSSYTGGWLVAPLTASLAADTTYIVTAYLPWAFTGDRVTAAIRADYHDQYPGGHAYSIETTDASVDLQQWANWGRDLGTDYAWRLVVADLCPVQ